MMLNKHGDLLHLNLHTGLVIQPFVLFDERSKYTTSPFKCQDLFVAEEHIFIPGWLREFSDSDLMALICPRPVLVQTGKGDGIAWWPFALEEFERAKTHYERLGIADRMEMDLHEGGHEIRYESGRDFLRKWL